MLKRSKLLIAFLVVTVICASVGFAAVSDTLTAGGKVNVDVENNTEIVEQFDADVYFSAVSSVSGVTCDVTDFSANDVDELVFTLGNTVLTEQGSTVTLTATISNASTVQSVSLAAAIDNATFGTTNVGDAISVTHSLDKTTVGVGETATLTLVLELKKIPDVNITPTEAQFTVTVTATPVN